MDDNFVLVQGRHTVAVDENQEMSRSENGGLLVYDKISGLLSELALTPQVLSFFNLSITNETQESKDEDRMQINDSYSDSNASGNDTNLLKLGAAVWHDGAVKLLFALYKDHQNAFKNTSIKNDVV